MKPIRYRNTKTGKVHTLDEDKACELLIGSIIGLQTLGHQMGLSAKAEAMLMDVLREAVNLATPKALVAIYERFGKEDRKALDKVMH